MERDQIPRYVTDASVAVKWFVEEKDTALAVKLKELYESAEIDLYAPSLLSYEVASALRFHPKLKVTLKQFRAISEALDEMQITREPNDTEWTNAFRLSLDNPISVYDAIYVALAQSRRCRLVTADATLLSRLRSERAKQIVIMLADMTL